jgi:hypothetical protein
MEIFTKQTVLESLRKALCEKGNESTNKSCSFEMRGEPLLNLI